MQVFDMVDRTLEAVATPDPDQPPWHRRRKAISALLPYEVWRSRDGERGALDVLFRAATTSEGLMWVRITPFIPTLFNEASPRTTVLVSSHADWEQLKDCENLICQWAAAVSAVQYTEEDTEVGQSVVDALLHIASIDSLRPHIPVNIWAWLEKQPSLPPGSLGRSKGSNESVVCHVRALGDIGILKSYLLLVWSEWNLPKSSTVMEVSIREDFSGLEMGHHREDLISRLDHILEQLRRAVRGPNIDHLGIGWANEFYGRLKKVLLEMDREAMKILTRMSPRMITLSVC
jgi:hypothetical protein